MADVDRLADQISLIK